MNLGAPIAIALAVCFLLWLAYEEVVYQLENRELRKLKRLEGKREGWREELAALREDRWLG